MIIIAEHHGLLQQSHWIIRIFNILTIYVLYEIHTLGSLCAEKKIILKVKNLSKSTFLSSLLATCFRILALKTH